MSRYVSKYVVCPFYRRNDINRICCEGVTEACTVNVVFECKSAMLDYERCFCDSMERHKECLLYQMLLKKWEEEQQTGS
ncbi:MAG: hypothetical protein J6D16_03440 [Clostridia bacterium]|nr:hypothetical protein [Clostridia bacterium]